MGRYDLYERRRSVGTVIFLSIALVITAAGAWLYWRSTRPVEHRAETETRELAVPGLRLSVDSDESVVAADSDTDGSDRDEDQEDDADRSGLPSLQRSDEHFRSKLAGISPELDAWLNTAEPIRQIILIINDFSQGQRLYKHLRAFKLQEPFVAEEDDRGFYLPAKGYLRYNGLAEAVDSMNVQDILALYKQVKPLCDEVFAEFGYPDGYRLEDLIKKAAAEILSAPVIETRIALDKPSVHYKFAESHLEELNPVHKQMLRMGPQNTRIIQNKLRLLIEALIEMSEAS